MKRVVKYIDVGNMSKRDAEDTVVAIYNKYHTNRKIQTKIKMRSIAEFFGMFFTFFHN